MAKFQLGDREYPSKAAAKAEFQRILNSAEIDVPLTGEDAALVSLLVHSGRHPEAVEKIDMGVAGFFVRPAKYGTRCFWVQRLDGTTVDFSYITAFNGAPSPKANVCAALREEINAQALTFGLPCGDMICELCGNELEHEDVHIDHADPTFDQMACQFAETVGGWESLEVECVGPYGRQLADRKLAEVWQLFHHKVAKLRPVHASCNLSRGRA